MERTRRFTLAALASISVGTLVALGLGAWSPRSDRAEGLVRGFAWAGQDSGVADPEEVGQFQSQPSSDRRRIEASNPMANSSDPLPTAETAKAEKMISRSAFVVTPLPEERVQELAARLSDEERRIMLRKGTEPAFCGTLLDNKKDGTYACKLCDLPLFASSAKFNSGTGWPSFFRPFDLEHVAYVEDVSHGMQRVEIVCARCRSHLGHVFNDAPSTPTGLRYCLNSASLSFVEQGLPFGAHAEQVATADAYFAGGCFWGIEDHFQQIPGVVNAVSGYQGGSVDAPTYKQVCSGRTGHAETVRVTFDPSVITYTHLLEWFFRLHDPTQLNRQGPDVGTQYRSAIFAASEDQLVEARAFVERASKDPRFASRTIVTQVLLASEAGPFYSAEDYHQDYHEKHGGSCALPELP